MVPRESRRIKRLVHTMSAVLCEVMEESLGLCIRKQCCELFSIDRQSFNLARSRFPHRKWKEILFHLQSKQEELKNLIMSVFTCQTPVNLQRKIFANYTIKNLLLAL